MKEVRAVSVGFSGVEPAPEPEKEPKKASNGTGAGGIAFNNIAGSG